MPVPPYNKPRRKSLRMIGYDYSFPGAYFITIVTNGRLCLFGEIRHEEMKLNLPGEMIHKWWDEIGNKFPESRLSAFIVMPNHIHGVIEILDTRNSAQKKYRNTPESFHEIPCVDHQPGSLSKIVQWFKTMTTNDYIRGVKNDGWLPFSGKLWQPNYYDHIIRNHESMENIYLYIQSNPINWQTDDENPNRIKGMNPKNQ